MDKKDIFIVLVCLALLFFWFAHQGPTRTPVLNSKDKTNPSEILAEQGQMNGQTQSGALEPSPDVPTSLDNSQSETNPQTLVNSEYAEVTPSSPVTLTNANFTNFTVDPEKGGITKVTFHNYKERDSQEKVHTGLAEFPFLNVESDKSSWKFSHAKIEISEKKRLKISRAILGMPLVLEQEWSINEKAPYGLEYVIILKNIGQEDLKVEEIRVNCGAMEPLDTAKGFMGAGGIDQRVDVLFAGSTSPKTINLDKVSGYDNSDREKARGWLVDWLAVQNKYFVSLVSGEKPFSGCNLLTIDRNEEATTGNKKHLAKYLASYIYLPTANLKSGQSRTWKLNCYTGPKKYDRLKKLGKNKESILQFDLFLLFHFKWMKGISLAILWCLNKLESICHNYGVAIIIITMFIRIIFWPITHQTTLWSKKMQKIQPLAQEIREKYKGNPQKMQQKTMELYREQKINPVAGCLPMVLQIPVFFALFNVLRSAIELRQAQFLWAADLSEQDSIFIIPGIGIPINPLAIIMGLTMVWQQRVIPTSADPVQQKVMMFMTIFFVFILYSMPSGLTLYWSINQMVSIFQHKITRKLG